jgi:hypothetical protein
MLESQDDLGNYDTNCNCDIKNIDIKLTNVLCTLKVLNDKIDKINKSTDNMNEHISFVEAVYSSVSNPFYYILNKVSRQPVKQIEMKKDK